MIKTYHCKKCGEEKPKELMCGTRTDAQCRSCKAIYKKQWYLARSTSVTRRNVSPDASIMDRLRIRTSNMEDPAACWLWQGSRICGDSYGHLTIKGQQYLTHILMWEQFHGPVPDGLLVLHNCPDFDKRHCINPAHLWLGTQSDNMKDAYKKGQKIAHRLLSDADIVTIHALAKMPDMTQTAIARMFHVSQSHVSNIIHGHRRCLK